MLIPVPGSSSLPLSLVVLIWVFIPALAIPTLFMFLHPKCHSCCKWFIVILFSSPSPSIPIHPRSHHHPIVCPCPCPPPPVVDCCIDYSFAFLFPLHFRLCFNIWAVVPHWKRGMRCRQCAWMKGMDVDEAHGRQRAWRTNEVRGWGKKGTEETMEEDKNRECIHGHREGGCWRLWQWTEGVTVTVSMM